MNDRPATGRAEGTVPKIEGPDDFQRAFGASRETIAKFETYVRLLVQWQKAVQLVSPATLESIWHRHIADSAQLVRIAPAGVGTWLDLGSGAGFPGLVMAILMSEGFPNDRPRSDAPRFILLESDTRKAAFLREVARQVGVPVEILGTRIELPSTQARVGKVDVISARALAPLDRLLGLACPFWQDTTLGIFLKGRDAEKDIEQARLIWSFRAELRASVTDAAGNIVCVRELKHRSAHVENGGHGP